MSELFHEFLSNNFTITQEIKTSSKSRIVLAINKLTNQPCIIKYLYHNTSPYDELKKLSHNCFPEIYYLYQDENITIIVEEYINGRTLFNILEQQEQLSDDIIKKIIIQLCDGLKILHEHNILHRDIKPSNIMLTKDNIVKLIDFDTARLINPDKTYDTEYLGTRGYAPPEQYGFAQTDIRSDIYALGITLQKLQPKNKQLQKIIKKAIKFDPDRRYQSVNEILQEFIPMATWKKFLITLSVILLTLILIIISYSYYLNKTSETPTDFDIQKIEDDLKQLPEKIDTEKIKQEIKDLPQKNPFNDIKSEDKSSTPKNNETMPAPTATPNDEKNQSTNQKPKRKYTREYLTEHLAFTYDIDGSFSPTTLSWQDYGDYIGGKGTLHFKIVNNADINLPLNYAFVIHGMKIPTSAITTSDNLSLTKLDIDPGDGIYGGTNILILPKKYISPNEVSEIWIDLNQCKLYDKTLYEDFSKKVNLSNGLPTNSTLDKDKNGPYMIDISFYSPILDIIYLYNDEFPVY
ncbi:MULTISPECIES: serine/threonine-protein kinase [Megamonas]|jgi:serine/threonine protein kinase|uniref:serine/threonine-protein kinase n=1 Tax=Megamonas TaxID=158846 RepID=UPI000E4FA5A7|nr:MULTISPECIES: serine/threonine-protein kinase [Megamonas]RGW50990.1 serine/threonine protein kinase [Megamonas funiformis]